nr:ABC transporter ATP-binding protein [Bacilli bacterium]
MENEVIISLKGVKKAFDGTTVVDNFNLEVNKGEFVTFLGPSGCGKSTTLRMIAGFEKPTEGEILLNGKDIINLPPYKRPINTVFQRYALFPYLDVYDNVAFGLKLKKVPVKVTKKDGTVVTKMKRLSRSQIDEKVLHALRVVDLEELENRDISTLSGGQQQRVAIARAIVNEPEILLLDEPLGALDLKMRKDMQLELKDMHKKLGITFIYVTHDQEEALTMSDKIVVMKDGEIQQIGTPTDIYNEPVNAFVANFIGESNIYNATMVGDKKVRFLGHAFDCVDDFPLNEKVDVVIRPEDVRLKVIASKEEGEGQVVGKIVSKIFKGMHYQYVVMVGKSEVVAQSINDRPVDSLVTITVKPEDIQIMKKETTTNLFPEAWINKNNEVMISEDPFECDITKLLPGSHVDDEGYLVGKDGKRYDLKDADVIAEIAIADVSVTDGHDNGQCNGVIITSIYKGDHYQLLVRTEEEEDFFVDTQYTY